MSLAGAADDQRYFGVALSLWLNRSSHRLDATRRAAAGVLADGHQSKLRGEEQSALELPGIGAGRGEQTQRAECEG